MIPELPVDLLGLLAELLESDLFKALESRDLGPLSGDLLLQRGHRVLVLSEQLLLKEYLLALKVQPVLLMQGLLQLGRMLQRFLSDRTIEVTLKLGRKFTLALLNLKVQPLFVLGEGFLVIGFHLMDQSFFYLTS